MAIHLKDKYLNWTPVKHTIFKDEDWRDEIHEKGYRVFQGLDKDQLSQLKEIFDREHSFDVQEGGMFYSMYSRDKEYRLRVHEEIGQILNPMLQMHFKDFTNVINAFVVKLPGEKSEFYVHQDTTGLDEFRFSPLSLWIPLDDVNENNGALSVIEKTHWFFSPYRGVSFKFPFNGINQTIQKYLKPVRMKAGEILSFDNRIIHNSSANKSDKPRIAIICGLFPKEATFQTCYQEAENSPIELYEHEDNYMLNYPHFFYNCTDRPHSGIKTKNIHELFPKMNAEDFEELCHMNDIVPRQELEHSSIDNVNCQLIAEPDGINRFEEEVVVQPKRGFFASLFSRS